MFNTWPLIDGAFVPEASRLWFIAPAWRNLFENTLTVQFDHRMLAYAIWVLAGLHAIDARQARSGAAGAIVLAGAVTLQAALGVVTLLHQAPIALCARASDAGDCRVHHRDRARRAAVRIAAEYRSAAL